MSRIRDLAKILTASTDLSTDAEVTSSIASHAAAADPHTVYLKESEFNAAGKNYIINGGFDIWQRGTSFLSGLTSAAGYTADRWVAWNNANGQVTRQNSDLSGFSYYARYQRASGSTSVDGLTFVQNLETQNSISLAGKAVTISFWARRGANYSATGNIFNVYLVSGTGTDQRYESYTNSTNAIFSQVQLTTSWQRFTITGTVGSTATEVAVALQHAPSGTAGANDYFDITGVQLELGSIATPFSRAGGDIQGELAKCQRYYQVLGDNIYELIYGGYMVSGNTGYISFPYPVTMRTTPTGTLVGGWAVFNTGQPIIQSTHPKTISLRVASTVTGQFYFHSNTTYYLTMSAEL